MAGVYSVVLLELNTSEFEVSFPVPAGYVAIMRDLQATSSVAPAGIAVYNDNGTILSLGFPDLYEPYSITQISWSGRTVVEAGDTIRMLGLEGSETAILSGYLLTA